MEAELLAAATSVLAKKPFRRATFTERLPDEVTASSLTECEAVTRMRERLRSSVYVALRTIEVSFDDGNLYLRGTVPTFYTKQVLLSLAEDLAAAGVVKIIDETVVLKP